MKQTSRILLIILSAIFATCPYMYSGPVRNSLATYTQPDGSTFSVRIRGDEWTRIRTTEAGHVIARNSDGWWCYGNYDAEGRLLCTEHIVGRDVPVEVLRTSRNIPYGLLSQKASARRKMTEFKNVQALESVRRANSAATKGTTKTTHKKGIAILAQFQDVEFTYSRTDFLNLLNQKGYKGTGSAKDYYESQFGSDWEFTFDVSEIITLPNTLRYYGENNTTDDSDIRPAEMIRDACRQADNMIDFSQYDQDGDGEVDNVYVFVAGYDEAENTDQTELIWAHQWYVYDGAGLRLSCDGVLINRYACSAELSGRKSMTGIGSFCHEYAHTFGLPDFYDTDYDDDGAWAAGLWKTTSLMDGGNYNNDSATPPNFNCIERMLLGLSDPVELSAGSSYTLEPVHLNGQSYIMSGKKDGEYFLFECRSNEGWDEYIGGKGMLVYHIDENAKVFVEGIGKIDRWYYNMVNTDPDHQCADLIEADGRRDRITDNRQFNSIKGIFYPQTNVTSITAENTPSFKFWNSEAPSMSVTGIMQSGDNIKFNVVDGSAVPEVPDVKDFTYHAFPDAIFISFRSASPSIEADAVLEWRKDGSTQYNTLTLSHTQNGTYAYLITGLEGDNTLYDLQIRFVGSGAIGNTKKSQVMTKRKPAVSWPYLYCTDNGDIKSTEGFIAHVVNAGDAASVSWFLDGKELEVKDDFHIYPDKNGLLSCRIMWKDGSSDIITKEITITDVQ